MHFDSKCLDAILIDLGYHPAVVVRTNPDGSGSETTLHLKPDYARAEALMQRACGYRLWQSCMQYVVLLKDGRVFSKGEERWRELLQWVCSQGFARGCKMLRDDHIPIVPSLQSPILAWTGNARGPTKLPARIEQPEEAPLAPATKQAESEGVAKIRAMLKAKCDQGDPGSCNAISKESQSPEAKQPVGNESKQPFGNPDGTLSADDLRRFCNDLRVASACYALARAIERGKAKPRNPEEAKLALQQACVRGFKKACDP